VIAKAFLLGAGAAARNHEKDDGNRAAKQQNRDEVLPYHAGKVDQSAGFVGSAYCRSAVRGKRNETPPTESVSCSPTPKRNNSAADDDQRASGQDWHGGKRTKDGKIDDLPGNEEGRDI
jgi:hypothetical protein